MMRIANKPRVQGHVNAGEKSLESLSCWLLVSGRNFGPRIGRVVVANKEPPRHRSMYLHHYFHARLVPRPTHLLLIKQSSTSTAILPSFTPPSWPLPTPSKPSRRPSPPRSSCQGRRNTPSSATRTSLSSRATSPRPVSSAPRATKKSPPS